MKARRLVQPRRIAELALVLTFVEAIFAGAASAPLSALLAPFTDSELLGAGTPHALEALRLAPARLAEVARVSLAWFVAGHFALILVRYYVYRRTAHFARFSAVGAPSFVPFLLLSLAALLSKLLLLATLALLTANFARAGTSMQLLGFGVATLLLALHASLATWFDASRVLVSVGNSSIGALARGTSAAMNARLVALRAGLALLHLGTAPLGYLAVALTEGGAPGVAAAAAVQGLLFGLCYAEVRWIRTLGGQLGLSLGPTRTEPAGAEPAAAESAQTAPSPSGA